MKRTYIVQNLDCANCAAKIEASINKLDLVDEAVLSFATRKLQVRASSFDGLLEQLQACADAVEDGVVLAEMEEHSSDEEPEEKRELAELVIGGVLFIAVTWLDLVPEDYKLYASLATYLLLGGRIVAAAVKNLLKGHFFDENFLMTIATIGAFAIQAWEEAVGVMLFYRIGEYFEERAVEKSRSQIMEAVDMRPETVNLLNEDGMQVIPAGEAKVGDVLLVRAGDRVPLDGIVVAGESFVDTAPVTGEPVPVKKSVGDEVVSGCVNTNGMLKISVRKVLAESMVTKILDSVENAAANKPLVERFITRFARVYTPFVVVVALLTALIPGYLTGEWEKWFYTALTFLVISCPCALVLSVPLAFFSGIGSASREGILFKGGAVLEALKNVRAVVLDKTGTITKAEFAVQKIVPAADISVEKLLYTCAGAETVSSHPIAVSIVKAAKEKGMLLQRPDSFEEIAGEGLAVVKCGRKILCGNSKLMQRYGVDIGAYAPAVSGSEVLVAVDGVYWGQVLVDDAIKEDAGSAVAELRKQGIASVMLTGDNEREAMAVAGKVGIDEVRAQLLPQDKLQELQRVRAERGAVMFVGDGINDAPVLAGADVGAAMGSGADAAIEAADVVFMTSGMNAVPRAIEIAKSTASIAWQNVVLALVVKLVIMAAGLAGYASMWAAVFADSGVAMVCVLNSIRVLYSNAR